MANNIAFQPMGKTYHVTSSNASVTNVTVAADSPSNQYRFGNHSNQDAYVWISPSANPVNVAIPVNGTPGYAILIPKTSVCILTGPQCSSSVSVQVSVQSENDGPEVYITPGEGL